VSSFVPELLKRWGIPLDWGFVVFGVLGVQAITSGTNLGQGVRNIWHRRADNRAAADRARLAMTDAATPPAEAGTPTAPPPVDPTAPPVLVVEGLGVQFGALKALDAVDIVVPAGTVMGLIGPNGAGKSTFVDAVSGFLPRHTGRVLLNGEDLAGLSPTARARKGLRRTYQQDRVPPSLSVEAYLRFVARRRVTRAEIADVLEFFGCPGARSRLSSVDVGTRRLVEVAAAVLSSPRVLVLDEPAAGLSHAEHLALGERLRQAPARFGISIILIEHDLDLVRVVCSTITVLDFGRVLASGPQADVLADPAVIKAYMGETEML